MRLEQYRIYLRAELGKLGIPGDARDFLERSMCQPEAFALLGDPEWLARRFASQEQVDAYVARLSSSLLMDLTECCDRWRGNGIARKLWPGQTCRLVEVPVENVLLNQAESDLGDVFAGHQGRLVSIAQDPRVLGADAYRGHRPADEVRSRWCLANPVAGAEGMYRVFDGMHRAIQMFRNQDAWIPMCVVDHK